MMSALPRIRGPHQPGARHPVETLTHLLRCDRRMSERLDIFGTKKPALTNHAPTVQRLLIRKRTIASAGQAPSRTHPTIACPTDASLSQQHDGGEHDRTRRDGPGLISRQAGCGQRPRPAACGHSDPPRSTHKTISASDAAVVANSSGSVIGVLWR